jgi:hypothetical protein
VPVIRPRQDGDRLLNAWVLKMLHLVLYPEGGTPRKAEPLLNSGTSEIANEGFERNVKRVGDLLGESDGRRVPAALDLP